jgi:hypothetical protein
MTRRVAVAFRSSTRPHHVELTPNQLLLALAMTKMEHVRQQKIRLRFSSGDTLTADRKELMAAIREAARTDRGIDLERIARDAREQLSKHLEVRQPLPRPTSKKRGLAALEEVEGQLARSLTFNRAEAAKVAALAERNGYRQTAAMLRLLCDRALGRSAVRLEQLVDPSPSALSALFDLRFIEGVKSQQDLGRRFLQKLGGMKEKGVRAPRIYAAVLAGLRRDPGITARGFWDGIGADDEVIYKSSDTEGHEVIKQASDDASISFHTLRRYFSRAKEHLSHASGRAARSPRLRSK